MCNHHEFDLRNAECFATVHKGTLRWTGARWQELYDDGSWRPVSGNHMYQLMVATAIAIQRVADRPLPGEDEWDRMIRLHKCRVRSTQPGRTLAMLRLAKQLLAIRLTAAETKVNRREASRRARMLRALPRWADARFEGSEPVAKDATRKMTMSLAT